MKAKQEIFDLLSLLKVFDANYVSDEDCLKLHGLDVNKPEDVITAVNALLLPEFSRYSQSSQQRLITLIHATILDSSEDFIALFDRIELVFDNEIIDKRAFMSVLLTGIECV
ncbi:hypothetical protein F901_00190 [Acinetobacter dispersus]|uniref:hypothetical protein n=1 Tax=Acinetobacter dispersus TaxID=70348 RepID=UPI0002D0C317|nr:hypothetical protein [Acinetobacter dispersus]ENX55765.1 hypothetical protein F901_00190 [Acinetobacter dispersus]